MKDLITSIGSIIILMVFVLQFAANQTMISRFAFADFILKYYADKEEYESSPELFEALKADVSTVFHCRKDDVSVEKETDGIYYVSVPVNDVIACGDLLGISEEDNKTVYRRAVKVEE